MYILEHINMRTTVLPMKALWSTMKLDRQTTHGLRFRCNFCYLHAQQRKSCLQWKTPSPAKAAWTQNMNTHKTDSIRTGHMENRYAQQYGGASVVAGGVWKWVSAGDRSGVVCLIFRSTSDENLLNVCPYRSFRHFGCALWKYLFSAAAQLPARSEAEVQLKTPRRWRRSRWRWWAGNGVYSGCNPARRELNGLSRAGRRTREGREWCALV